MTGLVFVDLKKKHLTLLTMKKFSVKSSFSMIFKNRELEWFKSYLSCRQQFTRVSGVDSRIEEIQIGVPQGSCLGPFLFLVFIIGIPLAIKNS